MLVFVIGGRPSGGLTAAPARAALGSLLADLPFLPGAAVQDWTAPSGRFALAWAAHAQADVGGVRYVHAEPRRVALFAGRPVCWTAGGRADGRRPLDPRYYLGPAHEWAPTLDGRVTAARCDDDTGELELFSDALGAYPLFRATAGDATWFANSAEALRRLTGSTELDVAALASVVGCGWPLDGHPIWRAVRRVPRGRVVRLGGGDDELLPDGALAAMYGARRLDVPAAAEALVSSLSALADWPGRPSRVYLSGGRDSRVILAAALHAPTPLPAATGGHPGAPDQVIAAQLSARAGVPHEQLPSSPHGDVFNDPATAARLVALTTAATATAADGDGFPHGPGATPLGLGISGQGGEIARRYYGDAATVDGLYDHLVVRRPWRPGLLSAEGAALVRDQIGTWAARQREAGVAAADLPDAFYLLRRMGTWAGPTHGAVEWTSDTTSPLWSRAVLPHLLGLTLAERRREAFHHALTAHLAPALVDVPFEDGVVWGVRSRRRALRAHARALAIRYGGPVATAARAGQRRRLERDAPVQPLDGVARELHRRVRDAPDAPVFAPLDAARTLELLARPAAALDGMERAAVLRLATVVAAWDQARR